MLGGEDRQESLPAVRDVHAKCESLPGVKPESDSVGAFQIFQVDVGSAGSDFSGVAEQGDVQCPPCLPAILRTCKNAVAVAETVFSNASQALPPTEVGHEVEGNRIVAVGVGQRHIARQGQDFIAVTKRDVLLSIDLVSAEVEAV